MKSRTLNLRKSAFTLLISFVLFFISAAANAQSGTQIVKGMVIDELGDPMTGVTIVAEGTTVGTITNLDGLFTLDIPSGVKNITVSFVGYTSQRVAVSTGKNIKIKLLPETTELDNVVVIGYGTARKSDLTGSVSNLSSEQFNSGLISSPEQLINGKVSGVQIMSQSGSPTAGSSIRIRGGASLNASNDPLIVLDGVPLEIGGISGNSGNFLSLINPNDIESMTILKDASSTAIYGSRASNGVIIITTKKGSGDKMKVSFSSTNSLQTVTKLPEMLSRDEFVNVIKSKGTSQQVALLGTDNTDWNNQIYETAFGTDNNVSLSGRVVKNLPFRVSMGYYNQDGILKTDNVERYTGSLSLTPSFFKDHLKFNVNVKGSLNNNRFANTDAIWSASVFNPTIPVYSGKEIFGGYNEAVDNAGNPVNAGVRNPLGLLMQQYSTSKVRRVVGNVDMDYKFHFLPDLRFHITLGGDYASGEGKVYIPAEAAANYTTNGRDYKYGPQKNRNELITTYLTYGKYFDKIKSNIEVTAGYDYQKWISNTPAYIETSTLGETIYTTRRYNQRHDLLSCYARINYSYDSRYMLTATVRRDGTSRFSGENGIRFGTFPSLALGWRVSEEAFLKDNDLINNLKIRASYGVTGQQDGDQIGNYSYLPVYTISQPEAQYQFGSVFYPTYRPEAYDATKKWETTTAYNIGFDLGILKDRISCNFDYYTRKTKDLLATVPVPAGTNFDKTIMTNVGNIDSEGFEITLNVTPVQTKNFTWDMSFNATWQKVRITNLSLIEGAPMVNTLVGPSIDSYNFQVFSEGYAPYMFYIYHQLYDVNGKPIEGAYADLNDDGQINSADRYRYHSPAPDYIFGFSTSFRYKKWNLGLSMRSNIGNYIYNGMAMNTGAFNTVSYNSYQINNLSKSYLETGFNSRQHLSDYYIENASFLKMDNITLGYNFGKIANNCNLNISAMVQNVFTITNYSEIGRAHV